MDEFPVFHQLSIGLKIPMYQSANNNNMVTESQASVLTSLQNARPRLQTIRGFGLARITTDHLNIPMITN